MVFLVALDVEEETIGDRLLLNNSWPNGHTRVFHDSELCTFSISSMENDVMARCLRKVKTFLMLCPSSLLGKNRIIVE